MLKVLAGIVTYNPDLKLLKNEILCLKQLDIPVVIIDNHSQNIKCIDKMLNDIAENMFFLIKNPSNFGIAYAHNQILQYAEHNEYEWAITFDQDSRIPLNIFDEYEKFTHEDNVAILCPFVNYLTNQDKSINIIPNNKYMNKDWAIASASMIKVSAWKKVSGFDEKMFIDLVDRDFCIRIRGFGYHIIQINSVILEHHLGDMTEIKLFGKTFFIENHSAIRKYYKARNFMYLYNKKELDFFYAICHVGQLLFETIIFEKDKGQKCKKILYGFYDGINMK